ncbi:MAG: tail fiber domain-containing protein, partial [Flavobacteriales bacterium]|nr:tail fiber domain-containing protein [Flavobacteriales bacterium]
MLAVVLLRTHGSAKFRPSPVLISPTTSLPNAKYVGAAGQVQKQEVLGERFLAVYGHTQEVDADTWAGYFDGNVNINGLAFCTNMTWGSDENLKTNIQDISQAMPIIGQLRPVTYQFNTDVVPQLNLPVGGQFGFIAQEVGEILPELVGETMIIGRIDSLGNTVVQDRTVKTLNYVGLIPILVAAVKEQQATIAQLQDQIVQCCAANPGMAPQGNASERRGEEGSDLREQRLLIIPNPVADITTLEYFVPKAGKVSLSVSTGDGKPLGT